MGNTKYESVDIEFGGLSLKKSYIDITVDDYEPIPELHTSGPISIPMNVHITTVITLIERGLHVHFTNDDIVEKLYAFVVYYNTAVQQANAAAKKAINKVALNTENYLSRKLKFIDGKRQSEIHQRIMKLRRDEEVKRTHKDIPKDVALLNGVENPFTHRYIKPRDTMRLTNKDISNRLGKKTGISYDYVSTRIPNKVMRYDLLEIPDSDKLMILDGSIYSRINIPLY